MEACKSALSARLGKTRHLLLIEDPALKLSRGSMWQYCSLSSIESDGVNRSRCTEVFCSGVHISWTVYTEGIYPYPVVPAAHLQRARRAP